MLVKDAVVVVTGGASGLGAGVAEMVLAAGGRVIVFDLPAALERRSPDASDSDTARFVGVDIAQPDQVLAAVEVAERGVRPDRRAGQLRRDRSRPADDRSRRRRRIRWISSAARLRST